MKKFLALMLLLTLVFIGVACGGDSGQGGGGVVKPTAVTITNAKGAYVMGEAVKLEVTVEPSNATVKTVEWTTSDDKVATVDGSGNVTLTTSHVVTSIAKTLTLTTSWIDTGITGTNLATGTWVVRVECSNSNPWYNEAWSGIMSWYADTTNSTDYDEIVLHKAGHASNDTTIYLRTIRSASSGRLKLQICASKAIGSSTYTFKFRNLI